MHRICATLGLILLAGGANAAPTQGGPAAASDAAPIRLAPHRAVYDLTLARSVGTRSVESVSGRIVIDFSGDACRGYTMQTRQVTVLDSSESEDRTSDIRNSTFESGDGKNLRFKTNAMTNGNAAPGVDGSAEAAVDGLKVKLKEPKRDSFASEGPVLFPTHHMRRLIEAGRAGETTLSVKVFDGSDDGRKIYDTLAVIGHGTSAPAPAKPKSDKPKSDKAEDDKTRGDTAQPDTPQRDKPLAEGDFATMRRWPVTLSYFTQGEGERTPIYTLTFDLYENGVSGALHLDYGDFSINGDMTRLDLAKADTKAGECGK